MTPKFVNVLLCGSHIVVPCTTYKTVSRQLEHLQRLACLYISGWTIPLLAMMTRIDVRRGGSYSITGVVI